ncbi:unnamed protein product [Peniophora sp. CBMAI 1063]|nr:unnamed protein product [Peniophora sp. CBMAI 1063]
MSSEEQYSSSDEAVPVKKARSKKRRVQTARACERCRSKKTRCDGVPGGIPCSQCTAAGTICVFSDKPKKRRDKAYIDGLESRVERLQHLLERLHPGEDFTGEANDNEHALESQVNASRGTGTVRTVEDELGVNESSTFEPGLYASGKGKAPDSRGSATSNTASSENGDDPYTSYWPDAIDAMRENPQIGNPVDHYFGESSGARFVTTALSIRSKLEGTEQDVMQQVAETAKDRPDFWKPHPWELQQSAPKQTPFIFPDPDLLKHLTESYFTTSHLISPILHRGTYEKDLAAGKHLKDVGFASVVLLVCAIGARMSNDPRVLIDDTGEPRHLHSGGYEWYSQVQLVRNAALAVPTLHDLQAVALGTAYSVGTSPARASWILASTGIRMAMDMSLHRRHKTMRNTLEGELWKRAFWVLIFLDVWNSSFLGRPTAIALDGFDVDFPTDVDDRYWTHDDPAKAFVQPPGEYSGAAYFMYGLKIILIHAHALRTIYSPDKGRSIAKLGREEWERRVTTELDSALNRWSDSLPEYLQWNDVFLDPGVEPNDQKIIQTSVLHLLYLHTRITIHRPFVAPAEGSSQLSLPSLTICTSTARSIVHVIQAQRRILPNVVLQVPIVPSFMAGMVLLLRVWFAKRAGMRVDSLADMKYVFAVIYFMDEAEARWPLAGRLKDLLRALANFGELPLPPAVSTKRSRGGGEPHSTPRPAPHAASASHQPAFAQYSTDSVSRSSKWPAEQPAEKAAASSSSIQLSFGPPLARRADGLYPFDPASTGMSTNATPYAYIATPSSSQDPEPYYSADNTTSHATHPFPSSYPSIPLDPSTTYPMRPHTSAPSFASYRHTPTEVYPVNYGDSGYFAATGTHNTDPPLSESIEMDDSHFMNLMAPGMGQHAPMATMWSSLPATFQMEDWDRYVSTMAGFASGSQEQGGVLG